jgi:hypothetical protein
VAVAAIIGDGLIAGVYDQITAGFAAGALSAFEHMDIVVDHFSADNVQRSVADGAAVGCWFVLLHVLLPPRVGLQGMPASRQSGGSNIFMIQMRVNNGYADEKVDIRVAGTRAQHTIDNDKGPDS